MNAPLHKACGTRHYGIGDCPAAYHGEMTVKPQAPGLLTDSEGFAAPVSVTIDRLSYKARGVLPGRTPKLTSTTEAYSQLAGEAISKRQNEIILQERIVFLESEVARLKRELAAQSWRNAGNLASDQGILERNSVTESVTVTPVVNGVTQDVTQGSMTKEQQRNEQTRLRMQRYRERKAQG